MQADSTPSKRVKITEKLVLLYRTFEGPNFDIAQRYANVQKTMLFTGFYACLCPIGIVFSLVALSIVYWNDKRMLLRRHCRPLPLGTALSNNMTEFLESFFISFTVTLIKLL